MELQGKAFSHLCGGRTEAEQNEKAHKLGGGGTRKSVTVQNHTLMFAVILDVQRSGCCVVNATY